MTTGIDPDNILKECSWIWLKQGQPVPHQYVRFRRTFHLEETPAAARVEIAADSDFILYINGREIGRGQFSDWPDAKTYSSFSAAEFLRPGKNLLSVLAYYRGSDSSDHRAGAPGLAAVLTAGELLIPSDETWTASLHPAFGSGDMPRVTRQMGITALFDARMDEPWLETDFNDGGWEKAGHAPGRVGTEAALVRRPVPPAVILPEAPSRLVVQGEFIRTSEEESFARTMAQDALVTRPLTTPGADGAAVDPPSPGMDGRFLIFDLGREEVGLLSLDLEAPAGTVLDIAHGEHLDDGRVRAAIHDRNFADRYICREGHNIFRLPFRRLGARYLEVHITGFDRPLRLHRLSLSPVMADIPCQGAFQTHDRLSSVGWDIARRTLQLCMHEHYEDSPWREQSLYAFDGRNQALFGYYAFGAWDFAAASLDLLGRGIRPDGLLELCAPGRVSVNIPVFSLVWISALAEHWLFSGQDRLFRDFRRQIAFMLDKAMEVYDAGSGLYATPEGEGIWHFYEWTEGMSFMSSGPRHGCFDAPYNLFLHEALGAFAWMLEQSGEADEAEPYLERRRALGWAIGISFLDEEDGLLATFMEKGRLCHRSGLVQCLALAEDVLPTSQAATLADRLCRDGLPPMQMSSMHYLLPAMREHGPRARDLVVSTLRKTWFPMILSGATSYWETTEGSSTFGGAGSLCHGWSALPTCYCQSWLLGIRPLEPGFVRFSVSPCSGRLYSAEGTVPTPAGPLNAKWSRGRAGLTYEISGPPELKPCFESLPEFPIDNAFWNGVQVNCPPPRAAH